MSVPPKLIGSALAGLVALAGTIGAGVQEYVPEASSELVTYQIACTQAHAFHDAWVFKSTNGRMAFTDGESHRPEITAKAYARMGIGIAASLHTQRLARDKMLILDGKYTPRAEDYQYAGEAWEAIGKAFGVQTAWGGRFNDANHFSCAWQGRK
jgi:hypothetical protein